MEKTERTFWPIQQLLQCYCYIPYALLYIPVIVQIFHILIYVCLLYFSTIENYMLQSIIRVFLFLFTSPVVLLYICAYCVICGIVTLSFQLFMQNVSLNITKCHFFKLLFKYNCLHFSLTAQPHTTDPHLPPSILSHLVCPWVLYTCFLT